MRRTLAAALLALALCAPAAGAPNATGTGWAAASIRAVTKAGLFPGTATAFRPAEPLTAGDLGSLLAALGRPPAHPPANPAAPVTIAALDAALVDALGLRPAARAFSAGVRAAGLRPPSRFGTEVVARLLGLRTDLPVHDDALEPKPQQPSTRADAAFSAARILSLGRPVAGVAPARGLSALRRAESGWESQYVRDAAATFSLPEFTPLQQEVLRTAVSLIGYPYVWGGVDERIGRGFDCSGFVWRVFKLASYHDAPDLGQTLQGRTAAQMAGEVPKAERIRLADVQPADVLFVGSGPHSKPAQIGHTSIYLGNGWLIHASGQGVALGRLAAYATTFAWARRPLAESGLEAPQGGVVVTAAAA